MVNVESIEMLTTIYGQTKMCCTFNNGFAKTWKIMLIGNIGLKCKEI